MRLALLDFFANPVSKNGQPLYDKNAHLSWYRGLQTEEPMRRVLVENQFGRFDIRTGTGYGLLVPSQKVEEGSEFPKALDHYKVYRLVDVEKVPDAKLKLRDQFGTEEVALRLPMYFAVPVVKDVRRQETPDPERARAPADLRHHAAGRPEEDRREEPVCQGHLRPLGAERDAGGTEPEDL